MFAKELGSRLRDSGITTYAVHPGAVDTTLSRHANSTIEGLPFKDFLYRLIYINMTKTAAQGAQTSLYCCLEESIASHSGRYYADCGEAKGSHHAEDEELARRLWDIGADVTGCSKDL